MPSWANSAGGCARRKPRTSSANACSSALHPKSMARSLYCKEGRSDTGPGGRDRLPSRETAMDTTYTLDEFLADTRATIKAKGIPSGLAEIRDRLEKLLHNP